ncbi:hypothetical protein RvY_09915-2 [Ramazzottius varieornatus]|uniref:Uncharacterized protein n=1 Tax=Ramazzottius varieornatus TaxID=947166 RepID=A0A1D1VB00_RAMVA|nr:hypothetical protein RvY_09915-2 [Ramazzottius varieornatus]
MKTTLLVYKSCIRYLKALLVLQSFPSLWKVPKFLLPPSHLATPCPPQMVPLLGTVPGVVALLQRPRVQCQIPMSLRAAAFLGSRSVIRHHCTMTQTILPNYQMTMHFCHDSLSFPYDHQRCRTEYDRPQLNGRQSGYCS